MSGLPVSYDAAASYKIDHSGRVSREVFQVVVGFFFVHATIALFGRIGIRLVIRRRLYLDDWLLLFGYAALCAATAVIYRFCHLIYILNALKYETSVIPTAEDLHAVGQAQAINYSLLAVIWTAICSVKLCFLAALKVLIANVSRRATIVYWIAVALSIVTWFLSWTISWMICPYVGVELLAHCAPETPYAKTLGLSIMVTVLDIVTDLIIVSIPVWILRNIQLRLKQKLGIGVFLCLSIVMIGVTITRVAASRYKGFQDYSWEYLILYLEACIAITMASIAAFRSVFVENKRRHEEEQNRVNDMVQRPRRPENVRGRIERMRADAKKDADYDSSSTGNQSYLPRARLEGPKLKGMLTYINNFGNRSESRLSSAERSDHKMSTTQNTMNSDMRSIDEMCGDSWLHSYKGSSSDDTTKGSSVR